MKAESKCSVVEMQHAFLHQTGGVAHARDVAAASFDFKIVEVRAAKNDARSRRSGKNAEMYGSSAVEADSLTTDGSA